MSNGTNNNPLTELVADIAEAIQEGSLQDPEPEIGTPTKNWEPRFGCVVSDFNQIDVTDSDGKEYVVIIAEKES